MLIVTNYYHIMYVYGYGDSTDRIIIMPPMCISKDGSVTGMCLLVCGQSMSVVLLCTEKQ